MKIMNYKCDNTIRIKIIKSYNSLFPGIQLYRNFADIIICTSLTTLLKPYIYPYAVQDVETMPGMTYAKRLIRPTKLI